MKIRSLFESRHEFKHVKTWDEWRLLGGVRSILEFGKPEIGNCPAEKTDNVTWFIIGGITTKDYLRFSASIFASSVIPYWKGSVTNEKLLFARVYHKFVVRPDDEEDAIAYLRDLRLAVKHEVIPAMSDMMNEVKHDDQVNFCEKLTRAFNLSIIELEPMLQ